MNLHHKFEIGDFHLGEALVAQDACIVDEDVDAAPGFLGLGHHFSHLVKLGDIATVRHRVATHGLDLFDNLERRIRMAGAIARAAEIVDHHLCAAAREFQRIFAAKPAARTCDDSNFACKTDGHNLCSDNK